MACGSAALRRRVRYNGNTREGPASTVREMTETRFVMLHAPTRNPEETYV